MTSNVPAKPTPEAVSSRDRRANVARAAILGIPYIGPSLEQLIYGRADELRMRRIETTLREVGQRLEELRTAPPTAEEYATLLERVAPALGRASSEDRRQRFRDLLVNTGQLASGDARWADADLAAKLLDEIDAPGLSIIATIAKAPDLTKPTIVSRPTPQLVDGASFSWGVPVLGPHVIGYSWPVVEEWARRLREARLITFASHDARGGFGVVSLTALGKLLVDWTLVPD